MTAIIPERNRLRSRWSVAFYLQLRCKQSAHFGHVVVVTVDPVVHLFVAVFTLAGAVRRRRSYAGHSSGQGWRPGLTCGTGDVHVIKTGSLIIKKTSMAHARVHRVHFQSRKALLEIPIPN